MKILCKNCGEKFDVEANPNCKEEGGMIVSKGKKYREKYCEKCYKELRKNCCSNRKGDKKYGKKGNEGFHNINVKSNVLIGTNKIIRDMILIRNEKIEKLNKIVDRLTKENIRLKEELEVLKY